MQSCIPEGGRRLEASRRTVSLIGAHNGTRLGAIRTVIDRVRAICVPSSDVVFQRVVHGVLMSRPIASPQELEDELRRIYPAVRVRRRDLSGERGLTWYVYRERDFPHPEVASG